MMEKRTMENLKIWFLYIRIENTIDWIYVSKSYWEIKIDEQIYSHTLIDKKMGYKHEYKKVLESINE